MGFGSYDESEQQERTVNEDDDSEAVNVHDNEHDGEMSFEPGASTDELLERLDHETGRDGDD